MFKRLLREITGKSSSGRVYTEEEKQDIEKTMELLYKACTKKQSLETFDFGKKCSAILDAAGAQYEL